MKKWIALLLALVMMLGMVACAADAPEEAEDPVSKEEKAPEEEAAPAEELAVPEQATDAEIGGYKIGFFYLPASDGLSAQYHYALDWISNITNCEMAYYDMSTYSAEDMTTAVESLTSVGCDGIIVIAGTAPAMFEHMNDNGVYYVGMSRSHTEEVALVADSSEYCCGWMDESSSGGNFKMGYGPTAALAEAGCETIAYLCGASGNEMYDDRAAGMEAAAADTGMEILTSYRGADYAAGMADILASYGDQLDGIVANLNGDTGVAAIEAAGYGGKIKYAQVDPPADTAAYMESDRLTATNAGNNVFILQMYMQLFNAISGADRLFNEGEKLIPGIPSFTVSSIEDWNMNKKYVLGEIPGLLPEELLALCSHFTPDTTVEEKEELVQYYCSDEFWNIDAIASRVGSYLGE